MICMDNPGINYLMKSGILVCRQMVIWSSVQVTRAMITCFAYLICGRYRETVGQV